MVRLRLFTCLLLLSALVFLPLIAKGQALETKKLRVLLSTNETVSETDSTRTVNWALAGQWQRIGPSVQMTINLDSDYARSDKTTLDRLRTGWRFMHPDNNKVTGRWYPVVLVQTEGDHSLDSVFTLAAVGVRRKFSYGFIEFTGGASKDIRTAERFAGDMGMAFGVEYPLGKRWKVSSGPKADYAALGDVRLREDRLRYSLDLNVNYKANDRLGVGYRIWVGNTVPNARRTQWLGLTYTVK
ncbi:MAG: hypothetical protein BWY76_02614 [bacterium ADurb.Bin429]|nr:MAG: hypothetical protein BWY76_02614 [bacterium ADurb.Bin429]